MPHHYLAPACLVAALLASCQSRPATLVSGPVDIVSNALAITPDFSARTIAVNQTTVFKTNQTGPLEIAFSANALVIDSATINGEAATFTPHADGVVFRSGKAPQAGAWVELKVSYRAGPSRGMSIDDRGSLTSYFACDWMLCHQDRPGDKSTLSVSLVLPQGFKALSIGLPAASQSLSNNQVQQTWRSSTPYSPYLFGFAAGNFDTQTILHRGKELSFINATGEPQPLNDLFATTPAMIDFFASKAGMALPTQLYSQILVRGGAAQEHATYAVIGLDNIKPILTNPQDDWVIAHELAHQWWGNSITSADWSHFWLNEGITVFMTAAWKEHRHGRAAYDREITLANNRWKRVKDAGGDQPLAFAGTYPSLSVRRAIQYSKGAVFMDHLRTTLGENAFWRGFKDYSRTHAGNSVVSRDFQTAMERASRRDLSAVFNEWVYGNATR